MAKINENNNRFYWIYKIGFLIILALPILVIPPYFEPPDWGKTIVFRSIMAILLFVFLCEILFKKGGFKAFLNGSTAVEPFKKSPVVWSLAGLFIVFLLATIFSVDPYFSLWGSPWRGGGFVTFSFYFAFAIMTFVLSKKNDWKKAWIFSIFIGILVSLIAIFQYYGLFNRIFLTVSDRPSSTMGNPIMLAIYLLLLSFLTLSFAIKEQTKYLKIFYIFSLIIFLYTILITGSRAAYLGILISGIYFLLLYPIKSALSRNIKLVKTLGIVLLILVAGVIFYANTINQYPEFLQQNKLFNSVTSRLSINLFLEDPRFSSWQVSINAIKSKPLLGYGPENFAVGFDKHYDPSIPYLNEGVGWWDRAHNILIDIGVQTGILGIIAYLALFIVLFWQLRKLKSANKNANINSESTLMAHGIQATLIGYLVANFFSFDTFGTYLIFFLLIGYSMHLISSNDVELENQHKSVITSINPRVKFVIISILFCVLIMFLWQYNFAPFQINAEINKAGYLADRKKCDEAFILMDKILPRQSFLDSYVRMEYVEFTKTCNNYYPENNLTYITNGVKLISEAVKIQPLYTRYWLYLGSATTALAARENNVGTKNNLIEQANSYFEKALQLSPKRQEIPIEQAKMEIVAGDYKKMQNYCDKCIALNPDLGDCYWYLALSQIYLKDNDEAEKNMQTASSKSYNINSKSSLSELSDAYGSLSDWKNLTAVYEKLITIDPNVAQYHSTLAFCYKQIGQYKKARDEAMKVLQISPESKQNVEEFLKTLP